MKYMKEKWRRLNNLKESIRLSCAVHSRISNKELFKRRKLTISYVENKFENSKSLEEKDIDSLSYKELMELVLGAKNKK